MEFGKEKRQPARRPACGGYRPGSARYLGGEYSLSNVFFIPRRTECDGYPTGKRRFAPLPRWASAGYHGA